MLALMPLLLWERIVWEAGRRIGEMLPGHVFASTSGIVFWVLREYAWWFVVVRFTVIVLIYARTSLQTLLTNNRMFLRRLAHDGGEAAR